MRRRLAVWALAMGAFGVATPVEAADDLARGAAVKECIDAAANLYAIPPAILVILLDVEGGRLGEVSPNKDKGGEIKSFDIGPMQVNDAWLPKLAAHWRASKEATYLALRDEFCANVEGGGWILRQALDETKGDLWEAIGLYHSHTEVHKTAYLEKVLQRAQRMQRRTFAESSGDAAGTPR